MIWGSPIEEPPLSPCRFAATCCHYWENNNTTHRTLPLRPLRRAERAGFHYLIDGLELSIKSSWKEERTKIKALVLQKTRLIWSPSHCLFEFTSSKLGK